MWKKGGCHMTKTGHVMYIYHMIFYENLHTCIKKLRLKREATQVSSKKGTKKKRKMFLIQYLQPTKYETTTVFGGILFSPLYTSRLFHRCMSDNSICHFRGLGLFCHFYFVFDGKFCQQTL